MKMYWGQQGSVIKFLLCVILSGVLACSQEDSSSPTPPSSTNSRQTTAQNANESHSESTQLEPATSEKKNECTRGEPTPLLQTATGQAPPTFQKVGEYEAIETILLPADDKLTIRHFGCTHYAMEFSFTPTEQPPPSITKWFTQFTEVLTKLSIQKPHARFINLLTDFLKQQDPATIEDGDPLTMSEMETVTITTKTSPSQLIVLYEVAL